MAEIKQEELQEFWEWCGFKERHPNCTLENHMSIPEEGGGFYCGKMPPIDLNNLFKYAVPKLRDLSEDNVLQDIEFHWQGKNISDIVVCNLIFDEAQFDGEDKDSALALYQAIQKVRRKE